MNKIFNHVVTSKAKSKLQAEKRMAGSYGYILDSKLENFITDTKHTKIVYITA